MEDEEKVEQESADLASSKSKKDPCNIGKGVCYDEQFGPEVLQKFFLKSEITIDPLQYLFIDNSIDSNNKNNFIEGAIAATLTTLEQGTNEMFAFGVGKKADGISIILLKPRL